MNDAETIENFFGVYLLYCQNPKYKGRIYIGYTVDPNRRIKQHNKGKKHGGAWKTSKKGPWSMVMIIHGFPNDISALRFEWAWQHPHVSRRLKHVAVKKSRESSFQFHLRILSEMLSATPWCRLPLCVRWLNTDFVINFAMIGKIPPMHIPITCGAVISKKIALQNDGFEPNTSFQVCDLCHNLIDGEKLSCLNIFCDLRCHINCLADFVLNLGEYVPIEGICPKCDKTFLWGDIVRKYKGCYNNQNLTVNLDEDL